MLLVLYALLAGALSAFAFEPVGWWPLMLVAFAVLCELLDRSDRLSAQHPDRLGVRLRPVRHFGSTGSRPPSPSSRRCRPRSAGSRWSLLSLYLAVYPALATGLAWRFGAEPAWSMMLVLAGAWAITEWLRGTLFTGFPWNPAAAALVADPAHHASAR